MTDSKSFPRALVEQSTIERPLERSREELAAANVFPHVPLGESILQRSHDELTVADIPAYLAPVTKRHLEEQAARYLDGDGEGEGGACGHKSVMATIVFDEEAAKGLSAPEVKKRWPRFWGNCPDCGCSLIAYASDMHYILGDW